MSDQDHLSAEYMQSKAQGLLTRCGECSARLQILQRQQAALLTHEDLVNMTTNLIEEGVIREPLQQLKDSLTIRLQNKIDPRTVEKDVEGLAPASALNPLTHVLRESEMLHEQAVERWNKKQQKWYELALKRAGLMQDEAGKGFMKQDDSSSSFQNEPPAPSIVDTLTATNANGAPSMDDLSAMRVALAHLENVAPRDWFLKSKMDRLKHKTALADLKLAELQDEISATSDDLARMEEKKRLLQSLLEDGSELTAIVQQPGETLAQSFRRQLDTLRKEMLTQDKQSMVKHAHKTLSRMKEEVDLARRLQAEFEYKNQELQRMCRAKGINLASFLLDDPLALDEQGRPLLQRSFQVGGTLTPAFPVQFSADGSGRLVPIGQGGSPFTILGLNPSDGTSTLFDPASDAPAFSSADEMLDWCRLQLTFIRQRMDQRFELMNARLDGWTVERARSRSERLHSAEVVQQRLDEVRHLLQQDLTQINSFHVDLQSHLHALSEANSLWLQKSAVYQLKHRDSLVLLQRMGEEIDSLLSPTKEHANKQQE